MNDVKIEVGQIWEVISDKGLLATPNFSKSKRKVQIRKGEKIEIRFPYAWHFRCEDSDFFHAEPHEIIDSCKLIGEVIKHVRWTNKANLSEILRLHLYEKIK